MRTKIDESGKVEIPLQLRERAKLLPGAQVEVELSTSGGVHVRPMPSEETGPSPAPRLELEGNVLVVSGVVYEGLGKMPLSKSDAITKRLWGG